MEILGPLEAPTKLSEGREKKATDVFKRFLKEEKYIYVCV